MEPGPHGVQVRSSLHSSNPAVAQVAAGETVQLVFRPSHVKGGLGKLTVTAGTEAIDEVFGLSVCDRVRHGEWGAGVIRTLTVDAGQESACASIDFDGTGTQSVDLDHVNLEVTRRGDSS